MFEYIRAKAQKELAEIDRNIWIQEYVSRRENPVILILYYLTLVVCYFFSFRTYFSTGETYSFWIHLAGFVALPIVFGILHSILNYSIKRAAIRRCPVAAVPFDAAKVLDSDTLMEMYIQVKNRPTKGLDISTYIVLSPAILVLCYGYFAWVLKLSVPSGCVDYLIWQCVLVFLYGSMIIGVCCCQSLDLPLSDQVKKELTKYEEGREEREKKAAELAELERSIKESEVKRARQAAEANETYLKAVAEGTADENLMYQAARKGASEACRAVGRSMLEYIASPMYTGEEKSVCCKKAAGYLRAFVNSDDGELKYLYYLAYYFYEKTSLEERKKLLDDLRILLASGTLPEQYVSPCTRLIQDLISSIDRLEHELAVLAAKRRDYCSMCLGDGTCNYRSDEFVKYNCDYIKNPAACPFANNHRFVRTTYDD